MTLWIIVNGMSLVKLGDIQIGDIFKHGTGYTYREKKELLCKDEETTEVKKEKQMRKEFYTIYM